MDTQVGIPARDDTGGAGMVEMNVRKDEVAKILERHVPLAERRLENSQARARTAVHKRRLLAGEQVRGDDPRSPEVNEVEKPRIPT
jgi:hypothetical protein